MIRALLVEDDDTRAAWIARETPGVAWERAPNERVAIRALRTKSYAAVFLDFDLHGVTGGGGQKVADLLCQGQYRGVVVVQSTNPVGGPRMVQDMARCGVDVVYAPAFKSYQPEGKWRRALEIAATRHHRLT
mgnify:CR=1 FL=1